MTNAICVLLSAGKCRQPCRNGGKCTGRNKCKCSKGYHGDLCSKGEIISTWQKNCGHFWSKARSTAALLTHCKNEPPVLDCTLNFPLGLQACWTAHDTFLRLNSASLCMAESVCVYVCAAVCEPSCGAHGTCVEPNRCQCRDGWNGRHCNKSKTTSLFPRPSY